MVLTDTTIRQSHKQKSYNNQPRNILAQGSAPAYGPHGHIREVITDFETRCKIRVQEMMRQQKGHKARGGAQPI
jgi:hypothetical protein